MALADGCCRENKMEVFSMDIYEQITKMADEIAPELVAQRRDFHKFAEKDVYKRQLTAWLRSK